MLALLLAACAPDCVDLDGDGFAAEATCAADADLSGGDCHDDDPTAWPGSHEPEVPGDGVDQDCDGLDACTDLSCDGWPDIAFAQTDADGVYATTSVVYLGGPDGYSVADTLQIDTVGAMGVDAGDLDRDGYVDLVFASVQDGERRDVASLVTYGSADGFVRRTELPTVGCADPTIADVDADGWPDIVFSNRYDGGGYSLKSYQVASMVYLGGPDGFSPDDRFDLPTVGAARSRVADLDGDGFQEIIFANAALDVLGADASYVYRGSADGWSEDDRLELPTNSPEGLAAADLDGDGDVDLAFSTWMCLLDCEDISQVYWGDGAGGLPTASTLADTEGVTDIQVSDLDRDGSVDLVLSNGGVDVLSGAFAEESWVLFGGDFTERISLPTTAASEAAVADLDGDGALDLVFASHYAPQEGGPEVSQIYWGSGDRSFERVTELPTTHAAGLVVVGRQSQ